MALDDIVAVRRTRDLLEEARTTIFFDMMQYYRAWQYYHGGAEHHLHNEPG